MDGNAATCPFCGGEVRAQLVPFPRGYHVAACECGYKGPTRPTGLAALGAHLEAIANPIRQRDDLLEELEGLRVYCDDTLSGRVDGPEDAAWFRDGYREIERRASAAITKAKGESGE